MESVLGSLLAGSQVSLDTGISIGVIFDWFTSLDIGIVLGSFLIGSQVCLDIGIVLAIGVISSWGTHLFGHWNKYWGHF